MLKKFAGVIIVFVLLPTLAHGATLAELQAQLQTLLVQVEFLRAQQGTTAQAAAVFCPSLTRNLSRGARGNDVKQLQQFLILQDLLASDSATGFFGTLTERAIQRWQSRNGIVSSGSPATTGYGAFGPMSRRMLASCLPVAPSILTTPATATTVPVGGRDCLLVGISLKHNEARTFFSGPSVVAPASCSAQSRICLNGTLLGDDAYQYASCTVSTLAPSPVPTPPPVTTPTNTPPSVDVVSECDAKGDNVTDNRAALQKCIDKYKGVGGTLVFPSGSFRVDGTLTIRDGGIVVAGANNSSTHLIETDPNVPLISIGNNGAIVNETTIRDINLIYATQRAGGTLLTVYNAWRTHIQNVLFGSTGEQFRMGAQGIAADSGARLYIESSTFSYPMVRGIYLNNTSDIYLTSVEVNMADDASVHTKGIVFNNNANGIYATNVNVTSGDTAFEFIRTDSTSIPPSWGFFTNCLADTQKVHGWFLQNAKSITLTNSWSASAGLQGIVAGNVDGLAVNGSRIYNNGQDGIWINAGARNTQITNSRISGNSRLSPGTSGGVVIAPGSVGVTMQGNVIGAVDGFANTQAYGIAIPAGATNNILIANNNLSNNLSGGLLNQATGPDQSISGNLGQ